MDSTGQASEIAVPSSTMRIARESSNESNNAAWKNRPYRSRFLPRSASSTEPSDLPRGCDRRHQKSFRTFRTYRSDTTLSARVMANSSSPTKNSESNGFNPVVLLT